MKENFKIVGAFLSFVLVMSLIGILVKSVRDKTKEYETTRQASICPSLLSVTRSARDTLIVMKAEPLCNNFVLDNLK